MNNEFLRQQTRRHFFQNAGFGIGSVALASLMNDRLFAAGSLKASSRRSTSSSCRRRSAGASAP